MTTIKPNKPARLSPEELEPLHRRAESMMQGFSYAKPDSIARAKAVSFLGGADFVKATIQIIKKDGGENNLHYHSNSDSFWLVLKGRAKFYGPDDVVIGEFGPMEGTITPQYSRYWFASTADEDLELLHVVARADAKAGDPRIDLEPHRFEIGTSQKFDSRKD